MSKVAALLAQKSEILAQLKAANVSAESIAVVEASFKADIEKAQELDNLAASKEADEVYYNFLHNANESFKANGWRVIKAKWAGVCKVSGARWSEGAYIYYNPATKQTRAVGATNRIVEAYGNHMRIRGGELRA